LLTGPGSAAYHPAMSSSCALFALLSLLPQGQHPDQCGGGLHGYIAFSAAQPPDRAAYGAGCGFYSAVWSLIREPLADFQIGLASTWLVPDKRDDKDRPLAPEGTLARTWK
jgi:hypothetical protein